ncbi:MAG: DUF2780 domain-containing protein [Desulfobacterales bacterium]|nr:DUF2780 domain-containing protein [Desulfobacterales bacterium]
MVRWYVVLALIAFSLSCVFLVSAEEEGGLVNVISDQLKVTEKQAQGGATALLDFAKTNMSSDDFDKVTKDVPELLNLVSAKTEAGDAKPKQDMATNLLTKANSANNLYQSFKGLGMKPDMVKQFTPVVLSYAKEKGSETTLNILQKALTIK